jgi:hypothetical protein
MRNQKNWPLGWPVHTNIKRTRRLQDNGFLTWAKRGLSKCPKFLYQHITEFIERNMFLLTAIVGVLVVTATNLE